LALLFHKQTCAAKAAWQQYFKTIKTVDTKKLKVSGPRVPRHMPREYAGPERPLDIPNGKTDLNGFDFIYIVAVIV